MVGTRRLLHTLPALILAAVVTPGAHAQEEGDTLFEEIIVTAKKREQSIFEAPVAISAFSATAIEKQGITSLVDIGKFVPNLNVTTFSAGHTSSANPFIRGIGLQDHLITTDPGVSVYVDDVYLGRQVGQNWDLTNVERVEVLRGPQGTLYGRNSIGGAINIITRKPGTLEGSRVSAQIGTRGRVRADFFSDMNLTDTVAAAVSGSFTRRNGIGDFKNIPDAEADVGELRNMAGRLALSWKATDRLSFLVAADGNDGDNGLNPYTTLIDEVPNGGVYGAGYRNSDVARDKYDNNTGQENQVRTTNQAYGFSLTADFAVTDNLDATFIASDRHSEYESGLDDDSFADDFLSFPESGDADQYSFELRLNGEYDKWDFVSGLFYFNEDGMNYQNPTIFLGGPGTFELKQEVDSYAVYGNVGYAISDNLRISGGLRYSDDEKDAQVKINEDPMTGVPLIDASADDSWDEISWDAAVSYDINDRLTTYVNFQSGYQSGQFPARPFCLFGFLDFTQPGNVSQPNCFVGNEDNITAVNYEWGLKGTPFDWLQMSAAIFYTDYKDLPYQVSTTTNAGFDTRNIIVDQDSTGFEWESSLALGNGFFVHTTLGYIDVSVDDDDAEAPLTPDWTASISPEYTLTTRSGATWTFHADYSYRDDMNGEPSDDPGRFTKIDSRDLINFDIRYEAPDGDWELSLYGTNVTDERYDNGRLNTGDYILVILSNDASEFGLRFATYF